MSLLDQLRTGQGTSEQLDALRRYDAVMDHEMARFTKGSDDVAQMQAAFNSTYRNHLLEKSSLYGRLLKGAKPLVLPPPISHSYPWYEVVESSEPIDVMDPADAAQWAENDCGSERLLIHQSFWDVLEQQDETTFIVTYGNWHQLGFTWKLWRENLPAEQATATLCCYHNLEKKFLATEDDLRQEAEYFANLWRNGLAEAMSATASADAPPQMGAGLFKDRGAYEQRLRQRELQRALEELKSRKEAGLPEMPTDEELASRTQENIVSRLGDDWFIRDGLLYHRSWRLQRISPVGLDKSHYLDL